MKQLEKREEFGSTSTAIHQLRTPLTSIKWVLGMLEKETSGPLNNEQKDLIDKAMKNTEYMSSLISDILQTYQIEDNRMLLSLSKTNIEDLIENEIKELEVLAESKNVKIVFNKINSDCPLIDIDQNKIKLVINNLLSNAIKYSEKNSEVEIKTEIEDFEIKISITDFGIGIPDDEQKDIFTKFFRAKNAIFTQSEGTGLGLFISKNIIEAHEGEIWFDSHKDKGSTFYFTLPIK